MAKASMLSVLFIPRLPNGQAEFILINSSEKTVSPTSNLNYAFQNLKYNSQDLLGGTCHSVFLKEIPKINKTTNLIVSGRVLKSITLKVQQSIMIRFDVFRSEKFFLTGIGISSRKFVQDQLSF